MLPFETAFDGDLDVSFLVSVAAVPFLGDVDGVDAEAAAGVEAAAAAAAAGVAAALPCFVAPFEGALFFKDAESLLLRRLPGLPSDAASF